MNLFRLRNPYGWFGNYSSWSEARSLCTGYDSGNILEACKKSLLKVKAGEAAFERDSVLFDKVQYSWPVLALLLRCAMEHDGCLHVLDFGGSLGTSYYQNRSFLSSAKNLSWNVVEQKEFVACGKAHFEDDILKFFETPDACLNECKPNVLLLSCVLQYLENPYLWIRRFCGLDVKYIVIDLTPLIEFDDRITIQKVDPALYQASYPCWMLNKERVIQAFLPEFEVMVEFDAYIGKNLRLDFQTFDYSGLILRRHK